MMLNEVKARLARVRDIAAGANGDDDEMAHWELEALYADVLTAIATGQCRDFPPEDFAAEAIRGQEIKFTRWYS
jgi:hypothetical protein